MERRQFMGVSSITVLGTSLPLPTEGARLGASDVARMRRAADIIETGRRLKRDVSVVDAAERYILGVRSVLQSSVRSPRMEDAYGALASLHAVAGNAAFDVSDNERARFHLHDALRYAVMAQDLMQQARVYSELSRLEIDEGNGMEAIDLAGTGLRLAGRHPHAAVALHTRLAVAYAQTRDAGGMGRHLAQAHVLYDRVKPANSPHWLAYCDPRELAAQDAIAHFEVGQFRTAARAAEQSLSMGGKFQSNHFADLVTLSRARLATGQVDGALEAGKKAVDLLSSTRFPRWEAKFAEFRTRIARYDTPDTNDFVARYDARVRTLA